MEISYRKMIGGYITFGILGNYIYMKKIDNLVAESSTMPEPAKTQFIAEKGGANKRAATGAVIGYYILNLIINLI